MNSTHPACQVYGWSLHESGSDLKEKKTGPGSGSGCKEKTRSGFDPLKTTRKRIRYKFDLKNYT